MKSRRQRQLESAREGARRYGTLENVSGHELAKKLGVKHPKDLPFDQPNRHGCNGCDAVNMPLNVEGYCRDCARQQGPYNMQNSMPANYFKTASAAERAQQVGIEDMEDHDLTPAGLKAKKAVLDEIGGS